MNTFGVSGFRGSAGGPGACNLDALFKALMVLKVVRCKRSQLLGALSGIGGNPTFCADLCFGDFCSVARTVIHKAVRHKASQKFLEERNCHSIFNTESFQKIRA